MFAVKIIQGKVFFPKSLMLGGQSPRNVETYNVEHLSNHRPVDKVIDGVNIKRGDIVDLKKVMLGNSNFQEVI